MKKFVVACFALYLVFIQCTFANTTNRLSERSDVNAFINEMAQKHHFNKTTLTAWINSATIQPSIIAAMTKPAEKLPWYRYEKIFLTDKRIADGVNFWRANQSTLEKANQEFGVPPEIIIAILGVETFYGKNTGSYRVLDSLMTLGFDYPPRSKFFLSELEQFLLLAREENWDPTVIKGSYAGAMGKGQFIASSYRQFAIDFTGNGKRDLMQSNEDAIGSIANYFRRHGWSSSPIIVLDANVTGQQFEKAIASKANPKPEYSLSDLKKLQVLPKKSLSPEAANQSFALIKLDNENGPQYWLGAQNFYVITRYNHSDHYAMAVYNLSQEIKKAYKLQSA